MNGIIKYALLTLGGYGLYKFIRGLSAKKVSDNMYTELKPRIHKVDANPFTGGIEVVIDAKLKNPTKETLNFTQPFVEILAKGKAITGSAVSNTVHQLQPMSEAEIEPIKMKIGWGKIVSMMSQINISFPKNTGLVGKVMHVVSNIDDIISQMQLESKYSTYANGFHHTETEKF